MTNLNITFLVVLILGVLLFSQCNQQGQGFALPEGNLKQGKITFQKYYCNDCHQIADIAWTGTELEENLALGGEVSKIKTYGELVTSVIHPSHKISTKFKKQLEENNRKLQMTSYNEVMSVQELVDLVTFLQSEYDVTVPDYEFYPYY